jgi:hypothetical protein
MPGTQTRVRRPVLNPVIQFIKYPVSGAQTRIMLKSVTQTSVRCPD